ncbi:MAG TPA: OB-fold nucleic acid binding domain-containing protein, partial [Gemmatimonadales bacterium]|nr:OB-fold nucleic acid binding domain-containing protein [Gemmatimonadales bacterium]
DHVGQQVTLKGWTVTTRSSGKIAFLVLRDGTGCVQCVFPRNELADGAWERFGSLTQEATAQVTGTVREDARSPGGFELTASDVTVLAPSVDYPITPKEHGTSYLFEHRHLWLRSRKQVAIARVRHEVEQSIHDFFYDRGFIRTDSPILTGSVGEQAGELG